MRDELETWRLVTEDIRAAQAQGRAGDADIALADALASGAAASATIGVDALLKLGNALVEAQLGDAARRVLRRAALRAPDDAEVQNSLGIAFSLCRRHPMALEAFARARELAPRWIKPLVNEAEERTLLDDNDGALGLWDEVARRHPGETRAAIGIALATGQRGDPERGIALARQAIAGAADNPRAWQVLGRLCQWAWRHEDALDAHRRMLALAPASGRAWSGIADALLSLGRWEEGFAAHEQRRRRRFDAPSPLAGVPVWDGAPIDGTLVLHSAQGYGDMLMHARFLARLRDRARRVVMLLDAYGKPLARTFARLRDVDRVVTDESELAGEAPVALAAISSLAHHARATPPFEAPSIPYLSVSESSARAFDDGAPRAAPRIGVAWSVARRDDFPFAGIQKSLPAAIVARWTRAVPGAEWHSIQPGDAGDPARHGLEGSVRFHGPALVDFDATAGLVASLDLVITADTGVAHLAGALGKPVWLVDRANCCWRYRPHARTTSWYESFHIFRQARMRDWSLPEREIEEALGWWSAAREA